MRELILCVFLCAGCGTFMESMNKDDDGDGIKKGDEIANTVEAAGNVAGLFWGPSTGIAALIAMVFRLTTKDDE